MSAKRHPFAQAKARSTATRQQRVDATLREILEQVAHIAEDNNEHAPTVLWGFAVATLHALQETPNPQLPSKVELLVAFGKALNDAEAARETFVTHILGAH